MDDDETQETPPELMVEEAVLVEAVPWHNADTAAAMFQFAANQSQAVAGLFHMMSMLALGQSVHEWHQADRDEFVEDTVFTIEKLAEGGVDG